MRPWTDRTLSHPRNGPVLHPGAAHAISPLSTRPPSLKPVNWKARLKAIDRKRRLLRRLAPKPARDAMARYLTRVTRASFLMDGIEISDHDITEAFARGAANRRFRSRQAQRLRNHMAILCRVKRLARRGHTLSASLVVRWYTSISCGLSSAQLDEPTLLRLDRVVRQINSPHLNLRPAVEEIARLHAELIADPVVPSFNGILARLLLTCHLERCGLPPLLFDPARDRALPPTQGMAGPVQRLLQLVEASYDALAAAAAAPA